MSLLDYIEAKSSALPSLASKMIGELGDKSRRESANRRVQLYRDNGEEVLRKQINESFDAAEVRELISPFIKLGMSNNIYKRITNELARPVYSTPPNRRMRNRADQKLWHTIESEMRLNARMDFACRMLVATNDVFLFPRRTDSLGWILDVMTPDQVVVKPHPDDPTRELAVMYKMDEDNWVYWDDRYTFQFNLTNGGQATTQIREHDLGIIPVVSVHSTERSGHYWDVHGGADLVSSQVSISMLHALRMKLHKTQGEKQLVAQGDLEFPEQTLDGQGVLSVPEGTSLTSLDMRSDARHYTDTIDNLFKTTAGNYGINENRINSVSVAGGGLGLSDVGLIERRAELVRIFQDAELRLFQIILLKSQGDDDPSRRLGDGSVLEVEWTELAAQTDRMRQLEIWNEEWRNGISSVFDVVRRENPALKTDAEVKKHISKNIEDFTWLKEAVRAFNIPASGEGRSPELNGMMGPIVRDTGADPEDVANAVDNIVPSDEGTE